MNGKYNADFPLSSYTENLIAENKLLKDTISIYKKSLNDQEDEIDSLKAKLKKARKEKKRWKNKYKYLYRNTT